ncbi:FAD-dependent oxidoreductase [Olegusella massiliensis]|uniref:FAD-dependent oxidoreductase n=1 Tax=Olegusella massiliensis TaxID=1776381 RepID=UPI0023F90021|nr:FAD-dependent oxidoreductase [Olegusella massiliensis]
MKVVIVGGVAGGASAATRIRRLDEQAQIIILERSAYVSYANCGLPYYIGDVITDKEALAVQTPESLNKRFRLDVRVRHEVVRIIPERKIVLVRNLESGEEFEESYDRLLLSPGARPTVANFVGTELDGVFTLRTVEDTFKIKEWIVEHQPKTAVVAGGGFIGLEMAENLVELGVQVTLVQNTPQVLPPLDTDMAAFCHAELRKHGVDLRLNTTVEGFSRDAKTGVTTLLKDAEALHSDMVLLAIGVTPDTTLAREAGLELGIKGSIVVNDHMQTSIPDIYAVGDAVQVKHFVTGADALIALAGPANKQGRIAANNICGIDSRFTGSQGSSIIKLFDLTVASTGINETTAKSMGLNYDKVVLSPVSHASYYPGARSMTLKLIYEKGSLRILGAQIVGKQGVDKRIDVLATAIHAGMKATELAELDLAYAPPYSSAKDPVNMAGFMIENLENGLVKQWHYDMASELPRDGRVTLLDVRTAAEYDRGHIEGFVNIPVDELRERIGEIDTNKPAYLICQSGLRSYLATRILKQKGIDCYNFSGGFGFYRTVVLDEQMHASCYPCGI